MWVHNGLGSLDESSSSGDDEEDEDCHSPLDKIAPWAAQDSSLRVQTRPESIIQFVCDFLLLSTDQKAHLNCSAVRLEHQPSWISSSQSPTTPTGSLVPEQESHLWTSMPTSLRRYMRARRWLRSSHSSHCALHHCRILRLRRRPGR
jgi:hypothetical protein